MHKWQTAIHNWNVKVYELPSGKSPSQDVSLVMRTPNFTRLAVIDGLTPHSKTPHVLGLDGACYAARVVKMALESYDSPQLALQTANTFLYNEFCDLEAVCRPSAGAIILDIYEDRVLVTLAGDCELWAKDKKWKMLAGGAMVLPKSIEAWKQWNKDHPKADLDELLEYENALRKDISQWYVTPIGIFPKIKTKSFVLNHGPKEIILCSDGARLQQANLDDVSMWLENLRSWESGIGVDNAISHIKKADDVTLLHLYK